MRVGPRVVPEQPPQAVGVDGSRRGVGRGRVVVQEVEGTGDDFTRLKRPRRRVPRALVMRRVVVARVAALRRAGAPLRPEAPGAVEEAAEGSSVAGGGAGGHRTEVPRARQALELTRAHELPIGPLGGAAATVEGARVGPLLLSPSVPRRGLRPTDRARDEELARRRPEAKQRRPPS